MYNHKQQMLYSMLLICYINNNNKINQNQNQNNKYNIVKN